MSWPSVVSVGPYPAIEALFETKDHREADNKQGDASTNSPEVALCLVRIGDSLNVHSEV